MQSGFHSIQTFENGIELQEHMLIPIYILFPYLH